MKKSWLLGFVAGMLFVLAGSPAVAQYYGGYYPGYQPMPRIESYAPPPPGYMNNPFFFRLQPSPRLYRQWNYYNRALDQEVLLRSPLNPESDLQYMLRTF